MSRSCSVAASASNFDKLLLAVFPLDKGFEHLYFLLVLSRLFRLDSLFQRVEADILAEVWLAPQGQSRCLCSAVGTSVRSLLQQVCILQPVLDTGPFFPRHHTLEVEQLLSIQGLVSSSFRRGGLPRHEWSAGAFSTSTSGTASFTKLPPQGQVQWETLADCASAMLFQPAGESK